MAETRFQSSGMEQNFVATLAASVIAGTVTTAGIYTIRRFEAYVCDKPATAEYALGLVPLLGIGFHSFLDGVGLHQLYRQHG